MECPLCHAIATNLMPGPHVFVDCPDCRGIFRPKSFLPNPEFEKQRYELHRNDPSDIGYQKFVAPLCNAVTFDFGTDSRGLDYGSGTNSAVSAILEARGYEIFKFDPFFAPDPSALEKKYDFIACCEVMEHFHFPDREFRKLRAMLLERGKLYCMTHLFGDEEDFGSWYYKNDPTHVFIYRLETIGYMAKEFGFSDFSINGRLICLSI